MAGDGPLSGGSLDNLCSEFEIITRAVQDRRLYHELRKLCHRLDTLSRRHFLLHPSMCRCLLQSYALLLRRSLFTRGMSPTNVSASAPSIVPQKFETFLIKELLHTLREGERFLQSCSTILPWRFIPPPLRRRWVMKKAIFIALSTEILDVHLPAFVVCIFALARMVCVPSLVQEVKDRLMRIWTSVDEEGDVKRMQVLFSSMKAKVPGGICKLIGTRLAETRSETQLNLASAKEVPPCLWMDSPRLVKKDHAVLSSQQSRVVKDVGSMGGQFAYKVFWEADSKTEFTNEAAIQASLRHANVMHLLWCTRRAGSPCLVMESMDENLHQVIEKRRLHTNSPPFSLLVGIDIMLQIAKGMDYLHDMGIMHRDLKSPNILVRHSQQYTDDRDHRLIVKVADFGLSKVKKNSSLFTTKPVGTSRWRAPEVLNSGDKKKYTNKADVYSFAMVCAEILTGLPPEELLPCESMSKRGVRPQLPSSCPPAIADYIKKCWDGDASKRPTFKQICTVLHGFKACLLAGEAELLATSLPAKLEKWPDLQAIDEAERGFQGMLCEMDRSIEMARYLRREHSESPIEHLIRRFLLCSTFSGVDSY